VPAELRFQVPGEPVGNLLDTLLHLVATAQGGGGIFAWASQSGVANLVHSAAFAAMLERGSFDLVVGTDTITSPRAIALLTEASHIHPSLSLRAFCHDSPALFHPKFAWFELGGGELAVVVGSGNLTTSGMQGNWEIFAVDRVKGEAADLVRKQIHEWRVAHESALLELDDPRVAERVADNRAEERTLLKHARPKATAPRRVVEQAQAVMVGEPTFAEGRPGQANFFLHIFEGFFGAQRDVDSYHTFHIVEADGTVSLSGPRKAVTSGTSRNFRFELGTPVGANTRPFPIGVFLRLVTGELVHQMLTEGDEGFAEMAALLDEHEGLPHRNDRRQAVLTVDQLLTAWPAAPVLRAELPPT